MIGGPPGLFPVGGARHGPRRGRWFGDDGPLRGLRGTAILLGLMALVVLFLVLTPAL